MANNFERMLELVTEFFDARNDPDQVSVTVEERDRLFAIHHATLSEMANADGPMVWILLIPTTAATMNRFLSGAISERQLLEETQPGETYDAIYLCSASVLPEFQRKGLAKKVTVDAINSIMQDHPIKDLYYWPFSEEGRAAANAVAREVGLPVHEKKDK